MNGILGFHLTSYVGMGSVENRNMCSHRRKFKVNFMRLTYVRLAANMYNFKSHEMLVKHNRGYIRD